MPENVKMVSLAENLKKSEGVAPREVYYPSIDITEKQMPGLKARKLNSNITLQVAGKIVGINKHNEEPMEFRIELQKGGIYEMKSQKKEEKA